MLAARGATTPYRNSIAPVAAPANIVTIDVSLVFHRGLVPPAREESEAKPVTVSVSTVVVMSGTASFLTTALRTPIATAVRTMRPYAAFEVISCLLPVMTAKHAATSSSAAAMEIAFFNRRACVQPEWRTLKRPPQTAPAMNDSRDAADPV